MRLAAAGESDGVDTRTTRLPARPDLARVIRYALKPVDWVGPYRRARNLLGADGRPQVAAALNQALVNLVDDWEAVTYGRHKVYRLGRLHACHAGFVGARKAERATRAHRRLVRRLLAQCGADPFDPLNGALPEPLEGRANGASDGPDIETGDQAEDDP